MAQPKDLRHSLVATAVKAFIAENDKPTEAKLQKHLEKHLSFPVAVVKTDKGFDVVIGKKKDENVYSVKIATPGAAAPAKKAAAKPSPKAASKKAASKSEDEDEDDDDDDDDDDK